MKSEFDVFSFFGEELHILLDCLPESNLVADQTCLNNIGILNMIRHAVCFFSQCDEQHD